MVLESGTPVDIIVSQIVVTANGTTQRAGGFVTR
jgi:hypothetical protein